MIVLYIILGLIALLLVLALISGKDMNIARTTTINQPIDQVFDYIKYLKNHDNFSVWAMMDPDMKKEYRGIDGKEGFVFAWDSSKKKNVGAGEQEIKRIKDGKSIEHEIRFIRPYQDVAKASFQFEPVSSQQTRLTWSFDSQMKFPMNIMKPIFKNMLGNNLEKGLTNLKGVLE